MIEPFEAFRYYQALKLHFESDTYDAVKYNYKTSAKPQSFWKRKDKYFFAKTGNKFNKIPDLINFYVAHFINDVKWIGEMDKDEQYNAWQKVMQSLTYRFEQDINKLSENVESFDEIFKGDPHPLVITKLLEDEISLETVVILDRLTGFVQRSKVSETIIWPDLKRKILKYRPFINVDEFKLKKIVLKVFTS
jgi:hypothetical protein